MIFIWINSLNNNTALKNSNKFGRIPLAWHSINASKRFKFIILAQDRASQRHKIVRRHESIAFKSIHIYVPHLSSKISNKKQSP